MEQNIKHNCSKDKQVLPDWLDFCYFINTKQKSPIKMQSEIGKYSTMLMTNS